MSYTEKPGFWARLFGNIGSVNRDRQDAPVTGDADIARAKVVQAPKRSVKYRDTSLPSFSSHAKGGGRSVRSGSAMRRLRHAFTPSHPVADSRLFAGRRGLLDKVVSLLEDQHLHLVLYGDRGIGKTSIMRIIAELAKDADYYVSYTSCGRDTRFDSLIRGLANRIPLLYHDDFDPTDGAVEEGETLESLFHAGEVTVADATAVFEHLHGTQFLFLLDEFDRVEADSVREQIAELIKNLSDRGVPVQFIIAGVASNLTALFSHIPSIRRNLIGLPVTRLKAEETGHLLELGARQSDLDLADAAKSKLISWSYGLPYIAQLIALHAAISAVKRASNIIELQDVENAGQEAELEIGLRLSEGTRSLIENECRDWRFEALRDLAVEVVSGKDRLSSTTLDRLESSTREALIREDNSGPQFKEEAAIPYILLLSRHLEAAAKIEKIA